jgi:DNA-binding GntR family transcriptional regulator
MQPHADELEQTLKDHDEIFGYVLAGDKRRAMRALELHVRRALEPNIGRLRKLHELPESLRVPFLVQVEGRSSG